MCACIRHHKPKFFRRHIDEQQGDDFWNCVQFQIWPAPYILGIVINFKLFAEYNQCMVCLFRGSSAKLMKHVTANCIGSEASNCQVAQFNLKAVRLLSLSDQDFLSDSMANTALQAAVEHVFHMHVGMQCSVIPLLPHIFGELKDSFFCLTTNPGRLVLI